MYDALFLTFFAVSVGMFIYAFKRGNLFLKVLSLIIFAGNVFFLKLMDFWCEMLWFEQLGFGKRFWTFFLSRISCALVVAVLCSGIVFLLTWSASRKMSPALYIGTGISFLMGAFWGGGQWLNILKFFNAVETGISDPVLGYDAGFYLFKLPFLDALFPILLFAVALSCILSFYILYLEYEKSSGALKLNASGRKLTSYEDSPLFLHVGILSLILAYAYILKRFHLMYSDMGVVNGPGWTDVHVRMPACFIISLIFLLIGIVFMLPPLRYKLFALTKLPDKYKIPGFFSGLICTLVLILLSILIGLKILPSAFQWLFVEPNEITYEKPYIANNIKFTRYGFKLNSIEEKEYPISGKLSQETINRNEKLFDNVRLWDWRALDEVYKQFQEIRLYYVFRDVDIDRYTINGRYRQVMVSAREMATGNLPTKSRTFVNKIFKYTHGFGIVMNNVSEFTKQGLPDLLIKDIPPKSRYPSIEVKLPQIYYGEISSDYVVVNSLEKEFDYPRGRRNVYTNYKGSGGVQLSSLWRKFIYGYKFGGTKFFLSSYPTKDSRIMFNRRIFQRVKKIAPFLYYDKDPYIVLSQGKLYWIIDAYTGSKFFPYSEPFLSHENIEYRQGEWNRNLTSRLAAGMNKINYVRNSVKVVIDAYNGKTDFYVFEPEDPIIKVWQKILPELFLPSSKLSDDLRKHIRYPENMLLIQGKMYSKYHMTDPMVFYNQEDLWVRATEKYYDRLKAVEPYYIMWDVPWSKKQEFVLILPFTPKNRQVLIGWIAGLCDGDNYGRLLAYKFPKEKRVLGPQQVETKIDQDPKLSSQLTLWNQHGSNVIRGNVLAIPIENNVLYVEPIYLQVDTAAYPELRLVVVMHNDTLSYADNFKDALYGLFEKNKTRQSFGDVPALATGDEHSQRALVEAANQHFKNYLKATGEKNYMKAAEELKNLEKSLEKLEKDLEKGGN